MKLKKKSKNLIFLIFAISLFLFTRIYVLNHPPQNYSDVSHDYERYANMWWYGLPPYKKHLYEYPPATIPFLVFPLLFDQLEIGKYYQNYRIQIFIFEIFFFILILKFIQKQKIQFLQKILPILFFIFSGVIAKDFYYEGIDLLFSSTLALVIISIYLYNQEKIRNRIFTYALFWWSVALKFMSLPLLPIIFLTKKFNLNKEIISVFLGFFIIWIIPLIFYRSSLSVSIYFHKNRPLKYSSFGSYLIEGINFFTHSEKRINKPPDFAFSGPISQNINQIFSFLFPLSILSFLIFTACKIANNKILIFIKNILFDKLNPKITCQQIINFTIIFFCLLLYFSKTVSQPFAIWFIPIVTLLTFKNLKTQIIYYLLIFFYISQMTYPLFKFNPSQIFIKPFTYGYLLDTIRFITLFSVLIFNLKILNYGKKFKL